MRWRKIMSPGLLASILLQTISLMTCVQARPITIYQLWAQHDVKVKRCLLRLDLFDEFKARCEVLVVLAGDERSFTAIILETNLYWLITHGLKKSGLPL